MEWLLSKVFILGAGEVGASCAMVLLSAIS